MMKTDLGVPYFVVVYLLLVRSNGPNSERSLKHRNFKGRFNISLISLGFGEMINHNCATLAVSDWCK